MTSSMTLFALAEQATSPRGALQLYKALRVLGPQRAAELIVSKNENKLLKNPKLRVWERALDELPHILRAQEEDEDSILDFIAVVCQLSLWKFTLFDYHSPVDPMVNVHIAASMKYRNELSPSQKARFRLDILDTLIVHKHFPSYRVGPHTLSLCLQPHVMLPAWPASYGRFVVTLYERGASSTNIEQGLALSNRPADKELLHDIELAKQRVEERGKLLLAKLIVTLDVFPQDVVGVVFDYCTPADINFRMHIPIQKEHRCITS